MATEISCRICSQILQDAIELIPCRHTFCEVCINEYLNCWNTSLVPVCCPTCKRLFSETHPNHTTRKLIKVCNQGSRANLPLGYSIQRQMATQRAADVQSVVSSTIERTASEVLSPLRAASAKETLSTVIPEAFRNYLHAKKEQAKKQLSDGEFLCMFLGCVACASSFLLLSWAIKMGFIGA
mmetsp:Transcript_44505/g.74182  ORF Transcript_44505/g.74182 Transcript_44505/m.74182 type:complete len:182 (-) Transcript_44505:1720-2265(-)